MSRYKIQSDKYTSINETTGTVQNLSSTDSITVTTDTSTDGLVIYPHGHISFSQQIYVKSESRVVEVAVVPFEESGKGGGVGGTTIDAYSVYGNAGAHNALYRGKNLTSYFDSGAMSTAISNGTFDDIYPGDYIVKSVTVDGTTYSNVEWVVGDLDYHLHRGDTEDTMHHVLVFPRAHIGNKPMNATNVTAGGFVGSVMWTTTLPLYATGIKAAFGADHVLSHRELLSKAESDTIASGAGAGYNGATTNWLWYDVTVNLFDEPMVYGGRVFSSSFFDVCDCNTQIAAMRHNKSLSFDRSYWYWLRAVASSSNFAIASGTGHADSYSAGHSDGGVRPYFLLY